MNDKDTPSSTTPDSAESASTAGLERTETLQAPNVELTGVPPTDATKGG